VFDTVSPAGYRMLAMDRTRVPESGPKWKLVTAAEDLFARRGLETVSVRDVTKQAGMNIASVNYHFGSRDGLVAAVMQRQLVPLYEERLVRAKAVERNFGTLAAPLEACAEAWLRPVLDLAGHAPMPEELALKLIGRLCEADDADFPPPVEEAAKAAHARFLRVLAKAAPGLSGDDLAWRLQFVEDAWCRALVRGPAVVAEALYDRLVRFAVDGWGGGGAKGGSPQATFDF
jgi:AcrR family transcriptional regulator